MGNDELKGVDILPHREPFLFLDRLVEYSPKGSVGLVTFAAGCWFFCGYFPRYPIVPGVILLEAMCQSAAAGALAERRKTSSGNEPTLLLFVGAGNVRFRRPVHPDETLGTHAEIRCLGHGIGKFHVRGYVDDELAAEADLTCMERKGGF